MPRNAAPKISRRYAHFLFGVIQSGLTTAVASAIASYRFLPVGTFVVNWLESWVIMVPIVLFAAPTIRRLGSAITLVRVRAVGINFADTLMRQSKYAVTPELPAITGTEVAGTVEGLGDGVSGLTIGARAAVPLFANRYVGRRLC